MRRSHKQVLEDDKAPLVALLATVLSELGEDCKGWEGPVLTAELQEKYGCTISPLQSDKIQAALLVLFGDSFTEHWRTFEFVCHLATGNHASLEVVEPLKAEELVMALADILTIHHGDYKFSDEVSRYAGEVFWDYGMKTAPAIFPGAVFPLGTVQDGDDTDHHKALMDLYTERVEEVSSYTLSIDIEK